MLCHWSLEDHSFAIIFGLYKHALVLYGFRSSDFLGEKREIIANLGAIIKASDWAVLEHPENLWYRTKWNLSFRATKKSTRVELTYLPMAEINFNIRLFTARRSGEPLGMATIENLYDRNPPACQGRQRPISAWKGDRSERLWRRPCSGNGELSRAHLELK